MMFLCVLSQLIQERQGNRGWQLRADCHPTTLATSINSGFYPNPVTSAIRHFYLRMDSCISEKFGRA
jgi:hypothetical protein